MKIWIYSCLAIFLVSFSPSAFAEDAICERYAELDDPEGDEFVFAHDVTFPAPELDFTGYRVEEHDDHLMLTAHLAADPREDAVYSYRYWLGLGVTPPVGEKYHMNLRVGHTQEYERAGFHAPNEYENVELGEAELEWNGASFAAVIEKAWMEELLGETNLTYSMDSATSDGPHVTTEIQGPMTAAPYRQDRVDPDGGTMPLRPCLGSDPVHVEVSAPPAPAGPVDDAVDTPGELLLPVLAGLVLMALRRR